MLKKHRKGQTAVEYLANNAWVVVIAVIGILVLWQLGIFTPPTPKRGSIGFSQITPVDWVVSAEDVAYVKMTNEGGTQVIIHEGAMSLSVYQVECNTQPTPNTEVVMNPGSSKLFVFYCTGTPKISTNFKVGDYYEGDVTVDYINQISGAQHKSVGKIFGPIEGESAFGPTTPTTLPKNCDEDCTQPGILNATDCTKDVTNATCPYCDLYEYKCKTAGSCGNPCTVENTMQDCDQTCQYCNPESSICEQGDCGKACTVDDECTYGCEYCINGECSNPDEDECPECAQNFGGSLDPVDCKNAECPFCYNYALECVDAGECGQPCLSDNACTQVCCYCSTQNRCEQGDCGKPCNEDGDCTLGCKICIAGTCQGCGTPGTATTTATVTYSSTSSSSTSSSTTTGDWYLEVGQVYPKNGSIGYVKINP